MQSNMLFNHTVLERNHKVILQLPERSKTHKVGICTQRLSPLFSSAIIKKILCQRVNRSTAQSLQLYILISNRSTSLCIIYAASSSTG